MSQTDQLIRRFRTNRQGDKSQIVRQLEGDKSAKVLPFFLAVLKDSSERDVVRIDVYLAKRESLPKGETVVRFAKRYASMRSKQDKEAALEKFLASDEPRLVPFLLHVAQNPNKRTG